MNERDASQDTKTTCFAIMMVYDTFERRVIKVNKLIVNKLNEIMTLL